MGALTLVPEQIILPFECGEDALQERLQRLSGRPLQLVVTDNATSMLSVRKKAEYTMVRLHKMFLRAGADVCSEVAEFIRKGGCDGPKIRSFIRDNTHLLKQMTPSGRVVRTEGKCYSLQPIFDSVNSEYFDETVHSLIGWGRSPSRQRVRRKTLGSYNAASNTIRINPLLDNKTVPSYFVEFIVYHEMLHAWLGIKTRNGRRSIHSREFRMYEKKFRHYEKAIEWEKRRFGAVGG